MTMALLKVAFLFAVTAAAEIVGCYLPWLVVKQDKSANNEDTQKRLHACEPSCCRPMGVGGWQ
jgi:hypothetical protein